jgi:fumarate hydratase class II
MPGKVNPTQAEAMLMVAIQIISSDVAVTWAVLRATSSSTPSAPS